MSSPIRMSPQDVELATQLGHLPAQLETNRQGRHRVTCACGYVSTYRNTRQDAFGALAVHLAKAVGARLADGVSVPRSVGGRL
jgi:hypothetical protein